MKILIVRTIAIEEDCSEITYNNQGIGLATELSKLGNQCGLVYYAKPGNRKTETIISDGQNLKIYHVEGKNFIWNAIFEKEIYNIAEKYDVIQVSECDQIASWLMYCHFPQKTIIYHGPYRSKFTIKYNLRSRAFDFIFSWRKGFKNTPVITKSCLAEQYLNNKGFKNTITLGVGLNTVALKSNGTVNKKLIQSLRSEKKNSKYILFVGAISKRKNLLFVVNVLKKLVKDDGHINYKLLIVGGKAYKEDKYFDECFEEIKKNNLEKNIKYIGIVNQETIADIYRISDVFVLPTQYDIFGMVYLEAMYFGVPIISSLCGGSSLLITDKINGFICDLGSITLWSKRITEILENDNSIVCMKENGKKLIKEEYTWEKLAPKFLKEYENYLQNNYIEVNK